MNNSKKQKTQTDPANISHLRSSPIHGLVPVHANPIPVSIDAIEIDPTNPGQTTQSLRDQRRAGSMRDSYDILARIVYPIIVCQEFGDAAHFIHVDGFGRLSEAKARGQKSIDAIVYPPLTLEQRICLRQTLNAAEEPFDAVSIIHDLQILAKERGLDVSNPEQIKTLVRDLPERVRKHEHDLIMLARLHPTAIQAMGESYRMDGKTIGLDKFRGIARILHTMEESHPIAVKKLGGPREVSLRLSKMYLDKKFSEGKRSQEAIRDVAKALKELPADDRRVTEFFEQELSHTELSAPAKPEAGGNHNRESEMTNACQRLLTLLVALDIESLSRAERRVLERTATVLNKVVGTSTA